MFVIDPSDQMFSYHSAKRETISWYKKFGIHNMEIFMANTSFLYTKTTLALRITDMIKETIIKSFIGSPNPSKYIEP